MRILFWFRKSEAKDQKDKPDPEGSIQLRITIQNADCELGSTGVTCKKSHWHPNHQKLSSRAVDSAKLNQKLAEINFNLMKLYDMLNTKHEYVTPGIVKEFYLGKRKFTYSVQEVFRDYFVHRQKQVEQKAITKSTFNVSRNYARHILNFAAEKKIERPLQIQPQFFLDLFEYMVDKNHSGERFARKVTLFAKQVLKWGRQKDKLPRLAAFDEVLPGRSEASERIDTTHLTIFQLEKLIQYDFYELEEKGIIVRQTADTLSKERDAFVFNCFTGMHHCDYSRREFTIEPYHGVLFLRGTRLKTKVKFSLKLLEPAVEILKRYNNKLEDLPIKSNQKRNQTLKQIAFYTGIPLLLTTKVARKTFCDIALNEMLMPADDVAACMGLTSTKHLKNYGRIREKRLIETMKSWEELQPA